MPAHGSVRAVAASGLVVSPGEMDHRRVVNWSGLTHRRGEEPRSQDQVVPSAASDGQQLEDLVILDGPRQIGSFTFQWPTGTEDFDCGWDLLVEAAGRRHRVRHGVGVRQVYGMRRRHSVNSRDALAVRLHWDDITSWVGYALARLSVRAADPVQARPSAD